MYLIDMALIDGFNERSRIGVAGQDDADGIWIDQEGFFASSSTPVISGMR